MHIVKALVFSLCLLPVALPVAAGTISVTGQGSAESVPDMATITLGITGQARTAAAALRENSKATQDVLDLVAASGVEPKDIQTSGLSLSPNWSNRSSSSQAAPQITGYVVNNQVTIRVRALASLGEILDQVVQSGANTFHGLSFGLQDPQPHMDDARRRAVADALRRATLYAEAAGVKLGPIVELSENGGVAPGPVFRREMAMTDAVPIAEGEVSVGATVSVVFEIVE